MSMNKPFGITLLPDLDHDAKSAMLRHTPLLDVHGLR